MIDLTAKEELDWLATVVQDLRTAADREQVLLVGAQARDLLLHYVHDVPITRATTDVDLAFAVADWEDVCSLREALLDSSAFGTEQPLRLGRLLVLGALPIDYQISGDKQRKYCQ